ncbi:E3 ubiquitin ligase [Pseudanabaena sp. FACHB-1998]|uniref:E3 ubiquitin ligase family protein n=1 Tax=Pseudanabaena sp. FACHB-1998 TaxID=2692858 RepID=UPI00167FF69F|nr:E3 ubiquitin ligase family protein [Pseudanabaena sp. FACHB-1998]MBD2177173.1 E3 ubiquitin ligase [Pseudanabaena sp. FACHB-1998]
MAIIGGILIIIGIVLFFVQKNYSTKLQSIRSATGSTIAELQNIAGAIAGEIGSGNLREYVKVRGKICTDHPLISELKQSPCVHYTMKVVREYEEQHVTHDSEGKSRTETRRGSETISSNSQSIPFTLQDRSGEMIVNPDGGNIETVQILDEFRSENSSSTSISFGGFTLSTGSNFGNGRRTIGYRYTESILPCDREVLVIGTAADEGGQLTLRKPIQSDKKFIISLKSEEELAKSTANAVQGFFYGMVGCLASGSVLLILGLILKK